MSKKPIKRVLLANPWWHADLVNGVVRHAAAHGWHIDLQTCLTGHLPETWRGDGMVTFLGVELERLTQLIEHAGVPVVSLSLNRPELGLPVVSQDSAIAGEMAARHLLQRGFRTYVYYSHLWGAVPRADPV